MQRGFPFKDLGKDRAMLFVSLAMSVCSRAGAKQGVSFHQDDNFTKHAVQEKAEESRVGEEMIVMIASGTDLGKGVKRHPGERKARVMGYSYPTEVISGRESRETRGLAS